MTELFIVAALICLNGLIALSELAVVSARHPRLKALAAAGHHGANRALALASNPGRINGAYSGETFGVHATNALKSTGVPEPLQAHSVTAS